MRKKAPSRTPSNLQLKKETLRVLRSDELTAAGGAIGCPWNSTITQTQHTKTEEPPTIN